MSRIYIKSPTQNLIEKKTHEIFIVHESYAISCPRTMMIHPHDTHAANTAVMCPWRFDIVTLFAPAVAWEWILIHININKISDSLRLWKKCIIIWTIFNFVLLWLFHVCNHKSLYFLLPSSSFVWTQGFWIQHWQLA